MYKKMLFVVALIAGGRSAFAQTPASHTMRPFEAGEKVAFVGNSITEQGYYESYVWLYYMLHYPGRRITVYNCGIGGDRAKNILYRLDDDVFAKKPTTICLTFGMNDSGYFEFLSADADATAKARVMESRLFFDTIGQKLKAYTPAKKILITSPLYDETVKNPKNYFPKKSLAMGEISAFQEQAAISNHWGFVDFFHPMTEITLREQKRDSTFTLTGPDRIHPGNAGHFVMAYLFLKTQGLAGKPVADIIIDAVGKKVGKAVNCQLSGLTVVPGEIKVDYLAASLPFPQDSIPRLWGNPQRQTEALDVVPFNEEMNREMLAVRGLASGEYTLTIDNVQIGEWTGDQLSTGINLALVKNTPEYEQAMAVLWLNEERMALESKMRAYYWLHFNFFRDNGLYFSDNGAAMDSLNATAVKNWFVGSKKDNYRAARYAAVRQAWQKEMDVLVNEIYLVNQPRKHTIRIKKVN